MRVINRARDNVRRPAGFAKAIGISVSGLYALPPELQPLKAKLGSATIIAETPESYLQRIANMQKGAGYDAAA